jgi:hypothetical protein
VVANNSILLYGIFTYLCSLLACVILSLLRCYGGGCFRGYETNLSADFEELCFLVMNAFLKQIWQSCFEGELGLLLDY